MLGELQKIRPLLCNRDEYTEQISRSKAKEDWELYERIKKTNQRGPNKVLESSENLRFALEDIERYRTGEERVHTSMKIGDEIKESQMS